jgi:hypothetical protein
MPQPTPLHRALDDYARGADAQLAAASPARPLGYAAAVGAGLALAGGADAAILYSGINVTLSVNQPTVPAGTSFVSSYAYYNLDFNGDATPEFSAMIFWSMITGTGGNSYNAIADVSRQFGITGGAALNTSNELLRLSAGAPIAPPNQPSTSGRELKTRYVPKGGAPSLAGTWTQGATGFAGFGFEIAGNRHFGWVRLSWDDLVGLDGAPGADGFPDQLTIHDLAWNDTPDGAITAGEGTPVPAPGSLALLATGAAGIAALRRRRRTASAG